jgi:phosphoribosyl-dephospho-CoA transferase
VVGRRDGDLRLGFTLPGTGVRRRVGLRVPRAAIAAHQPPPALEAVVGFAPETWRGSLEALALALRGAGLFPRAYGSLVTQAVSGETCLRPDSDIDLLIDCGSRDEALAALAILARHGDGPPRIDGEIRMADGRAVAWRELALALDAGGQVLVKSDTDLHLLSPEAFLGSPPASVVLPGARHAHPRPSAPAGSAA